MTIKTEIITGKGLKYFNTLSADESGVICKYKVNIIESERGWGSKLDEVLYFSTKEDALDFVEGYNKMFNPDVSSVPDWYMISLYGGEVG